MDSNREAPLRLILDNKTKRSCSCQNNGKRTAAIFFCFAVIFMTVCIGFILTQSNESSISNDMERLIKRVEKLENFACLCTREKLLVGDDKDTTSNGTRVKRAPLNGSQYADSSTLRPGNQNHEYGSSNGNRNYNHGSNDNGNYDGDKNIGAGEFENRNGNQNYGSGDNGNKNGNNNLGNYNSRSGDNGNKNGNNNLGNYNSGSADNGNKNGNSNGNSYSGSGSSSGSSFIVWGKSRCPQISQPIYNGFAAAASPVRGSGGSTKLECLPSSPTFQRSNAPLPTGSTLISPVKFSLSREFADGSLVQCSVCFTRSSPTIMIAGRTGCPSSWALEYSGHLMSTPGKSRQFYYSSENYCVDLSPDTLPGDSRSTGQQLTYVQAGTCFDKLCNGYAKGQKIACTVCSRVNY